MVAVTLTPLLLLSIPNLKPKDEGGSMLMVVENAYINYSTELEHWTSLLDSLLSLQKESHGYLAASPVFGSEDNMKTQKCNSQHNMPVL